MKDIFGIMNMQMLIWSLGPLKDLTEIKHSQIRVLTKKFAFLKNTILSVMSNLISNEIVAVDERSTLD